MSAINHAAATQPPRWMPTGHEPELCSAGEWWDAIRATEVVGRRAIELLANDDATVGPVILDPRGPEPRLYFLVPVGAAARWTEAGTIPLGQNCHVVVPPASASTPPGLHWHLLPQSPRALTQPEALRRALGRARREQQGPTGESAL